MKRLAILVLLTSMISMPEDAEAGRGGRYNNTPPMTPFGPAYDPQTFRQAGNNPVAYEALMQQKMMMQQQQMMMRQQQFLKKGASKAGKGDTGTVAPAVPPTQRPMFPPRTVAKKKKIKGKKEMTAPEAKAAPDTKSAASPSEKSAGVK